MIQRVPERKLELPRQFDIVIDECQQTQDTLEILHKDLKVEVCLESDPRTDYCYQDPVSKVIVLIAETPSINGIRWPVPVMQRVKIPKTIYELILNSSENWRLLSSIPSFEHNGRISKPVMPSASPSGRLTSASTVNPKALEGVYM